MPSIKRVSIVYERDVAGEVTFMHAYVSKDDAESIATTRRHNVLSSPDVRVTEVDLERPKNDGGKAKATTTATPKAKKAKTEPAHDSPLDEDELTSFANDPSEGTPKPKKKTPTKKSEDAKAARKLVPKGKPDAFAGIKLNFAGTFSVDKSTFEEAATTCGAEIVKKPEQADYVVRGKNPGTKKDEAIMLNRCRTVDEVGFLDMLRNGVSVYGRVLGTSRDEAADSDASD